MQKRQTLIATTLDELRRITKPTKANEVETTVEIRGTMIFTMPDLLNEGSDGPDTATAASLKLEHNMNNSTASSEDETVHFVCQAYRHETRGKGRTARQSLVRAAAVECRSAADAEARARKMFENARHVGVDAFAVSVDEDLGDYSEPSFLVRLGEVPALEV